MTDIYDRALGKMMGMFQPMPDHYDRALRTSMKTTAWVLLWWVLAILMLAFWGYMTDAGAQPSTQTNTVALCPTGALDAQNNPITAPCYGTAVVAIGAGSTGAVTATLPAAAGKTTTICGVTISALGGTATVGPVTITNLIGNITFTLQLASTASGNFFSQGFFPCIPAKAVNTAIAVVTTADGTATAVDVNVWGYQL
jgi:hypothetical protein